MCFILSFRIFIPLKKLFGIFLLSAYLISLTELNQLVKLPLLVEHFIQHKEKDNNLSLWAFLDMHYAHGDVKDADYDDDMKLPFKSHEGCISATFVAYTPSTFDELLTKPGYTESKSYLVHSEKFLTSSYLSFIWQPPKSC